MSQQVITNSSGYFEAPLLRAGHYEITVEITGFKTLRRTGLTLAAGQQLTLPLELEIGTLAETITVTGEAPLLEVNTVRTGLNLTQRQIEDLPVQSNMPVMFTRFAPGLMASATAAISFFPALRMVPRPIRVLTVDGHQLVQEGLAAVINREEDMTVVATASTGEEALDDVRRYRPDVVTLDLLLPDMPGEDLARRILAEFPRTRIVARRCTV